MEEGNDVVLLRGTWWISSSHFPTVGCVLLWLTCLITLRLMRQAVRNRRDSSKSFDPRSAGKKVPHSRPRADCCGCWAWDGRPANVFRTFSQLLLLDRAA